MPPLFPGIWELLTSTYTAHKKKDLSLTNSHDAQSLSPFLNSCTLLLICTWHWTSGKFHRVKPITHKPGVVSTLVGFTLDKISERWAEFRFLSIALVYTAEKGGKVLTMGSYTVITGLLPKNSSPPCTERNNT